MSIVISQNLVLSQTGELGADNPVIGYRNVVVAANVVADTEEDDYPPTNLANPATHLKWVAADTTGQDITIATNETDPIDYVGIAAHNLATAEVSVTILSAGGSPEVELVQETMLPNNGPAIFRFEPQSVANLKIRLGSGSAPAQIACVYVGRLLVLPRKIYVGHTPLSLARKSKVLTGKSESGNHLGRIVLNEYRESAARLLLIDPDWYRDNMDAFLAAAKEDPFFFAWRPQSYPRECGYAWLTNDPQPVPEEPHALIGLELQMQGIA